jgi:hypothetical protein
VSERVAAGSWVQIHTVVLEPHERTAHLPPETRAVALEMTAKGFLLEAADIGQDVAIRTPAGRRIRGTLSAALPAYEHSFGAPVPELVPVGGELRDRLMRARDGSDRRPGPENPR